MKRYLLVIVFIFIVLGSVSSQTESFLSIGTETDFSNNLYPEIQIMTMALNERVVFGFGTIYRKSLFLSFGTQLKTDFLFDKFAIGCGGGVDICTNIFDIDPYVKASTYCRISQNFILEAYVKKSLNENFMFGIALNF